MRKVMVIAVREYKASVKTKAFILSLVLMPVLMIGSIVVQRFMKDKVDTTTKTFAVLDQTGRLFDSVAQEATRRNNGTVEDGIGIYKGSGNERKKVKPEFAVQIAQVTQDDSDRMVLELSDQVRDKKLFGFVIVGRDVITPGEDAGSASIKYYSNSPNYREFQRWIDPVLNNRIRSLRFESADLDPALIQAAIRSMPVANLGLVSLDENGEITEAQETNRVAGMLVPFGIMMLMFMVIMVGAQPLLHSVLEEKMQRIAEVLLGSVSPFKLMMGKLLGTVGVSLTIATFYLVGAYWAAHSAGFGQFFPASLVWWFIVFQVMAVLLYGSIFIAVGAAVADMKEANSMVTPVMMFVVAPMFVWMNVVKEPMSTSSLLMSLFPPATPMLMTLRLSVPPGIPLWQPLLGVALVMVTVCLIVFASGRIFRVGILMQGKGANIREMLRWVFRG